MKTRIIAIVILCMMIAGTSVYASDISGAVYQAVVRITNNSTASTNVAVNFTLDSQYLIDYDFVSSNFSNTAIRGSAGTDVAYMPGSNSTNPWIVYVSSIGEDSQIDDTIYLGGGDMNAKLSYFPGSGGMSTSDAASLELSDNFTITLSDVFIDTTAGAGKYIFYKTDAIELYVDAATSGTITAKIPAHDSDTEILRPNAAGDFCNINDGTSSCPNDYQAVDDPASHDSDTTYLRNNYAILWDAYNIESASLPTGVEITSIDVYMVVRAEGANTATYQTGLRLSGVSTYGTSHSDSNTSYHTFTDTVARPGGGDWVEGDLDDLQVLLGLATVFQVPRCTQIYVIVNYQYPEVSVDVSGITTGEYDITLSGNGTVFTLNVGGTSNSTSFTGIGDSANDYISFENDTVLYAGSQEIEVDGVQVQYVDWDYGSTFTDQSGNSNDATPTFRTISSDTDVSAELLDFEPVDPAEIGDYEIEEESEMLDEAPNEPDDLFDTVNETALDIPDAMIPGMWNELLDNATIPRSAFWIILAFCTAMAGGLLAYGGVTKLRDNTASFASADSFALFIQALVSGLILVIWIVATGGTVVPAWIMAPYVVIELAAILLVRRGVA